MRTPPAARVAVALLALLLGAATGVAAVALHGYWWGLLLGVAAILALLVAVPGGWWRRLPLAWGWVLVVLVLTQTRPEGDYLIATDLGGYLLLGAGVGVLVGGVVGLRPPPTASPTINAGDGPTS